MVASEGVSHPRSGAEDTLSGELEFARKRKEVSLPVLLLELGKG